MCGFFGVISYNGLPEGSIAHRDLTHRGPDSTSEYRDSVLYLKHYRLAILGGDAGSQPMYSEDGRYVLVFNGEIYNYVELAHEIGRPDLISKGDTRVLIEVFSRYGPKGIEKLNGMFVFMIYDRSSKQMLLARDRFGVKPLYYSHNKGVTRFASEIKAVWNGEDFRQDVLDRYLDFGKYPEDGDTFYNNIYQIEAGTFVTIEQGRTTTTRYFDLISEIEKCDYSASQSLPSYLELFDNAIDIRLRSDVPVSIHLSGGIDSSAVLYRMKHLWKKDYPLRAFTHAFSDPQFDESPYAEAVANSAGVELTKAYLEPNEVPGLALKLQDFQDEPYGGVPTLAMFKLNLVQQEMGYVVSLEGQGGDESLGGYRTHQILAAYDLILSGANQEILKNLVNFIGGTTETIRSQAEALINSGFASHTDGTDLRSGEEPAKQILGSWLRSIQIYHTLKNKIPRTLRFHDRVSAAASRELRCPLLDYRIMISGIAASMEMKYRNGLPKSPLRTIVEQHAPQIAAMKKRSVVTPQTTWLTSQLREWSRSHVDRAKKEGWVKPGIEQAIKSLFEGQSRDNSFVLWQVINLNLMRDVLKERVKSVKS